MSITTKALLRRRDGAGIDWRNLAACRDVDPDLFFPLGTVGASLPQIEQAKRVCRTCPVSGTCLRWALDNGAAGVWGGTTEEERRGYRRPRALGEFRDAEEPSRFPAVPRNFPSRTSFLHAQNLVASVVAVSRNSVSSASRGDKRPLASMTVDGRRAIVE